MRGQEVSIRMVREFVPTYERRGICCAPLIDGLGFTLADLEDPTRRISWDDFVEFLERGAAAAGGYHAWADLTCESIETHPWTQLLACSVLSPRMLYLLAVERVSRKMYTHIGTRVEIVGERSVRIDSMIPNEYRPSLAFHYASLGCMRAYPRLLGLADAFIEADITPHRGVFLATPPPSRTLASVAMERMRKILPLGLLDTDNRDGLAVSMDESEISEEAASLGQKLAVQTEAPALGQLFEHFMQQRFCSRHVVLWLNGPGQHGAKPVFSHATGEPIHRVIRPLMAGDIEVGRIEVDLPAAELGARLPLFEGIIPWLSLGAANVMRVNAHPTAPHASSPEQRIVVVTARWNLTTREAQVLRLLMGGAANKEVARAMGSSVKTVEFHVGNLLRKAGVSTRGMLLARILESEQAAAHAEHRDG